MLPRVSETKGKQTYEDHHLDEWQPAQLFIGENSCPRKKEGDFDFEENEDKGDDVEAYVELDPWRSNWFFAAFVGC